jgi:hypothetical protein
MAFIEYTFFSDKRNYLILYKKLHGGFYWHEVVIAFIERQLFHNKRRNLTVYKKHQVDLIGTEL